MIGAGAKILGPITIGKNSRIGANAVVIKAVSANSIVVGVPGRIIKRGLVNLLADGPDLDHGNLPDLISEKLDSLIERVTNLEKQIGKNSDSMQYIP